MQKADIPDLKNKFETSHTFLMLTSTVGLVAAVVGSLPVAVAFTVISLIVAVPMLHSLFQLNKTLKSK